MLQPLPADFVVCIDNSRSITPPEQTLIREATMLLADLADAGDQISVITFGERARLVTTVLVRSNDDRRQFKQQVRDQIDFRENRSDIRAGIRVLAEHLDEVFRPTGQSVRAPLVLSDGRLEPADGDPRSAFAAMRDEIAGRLAGTDIYAVALGETTSGMPIFDLDGTPLTGVGLMRDHIARGPDRFFHARTLDELPQIAVLVLNSAKGLASLGEAGSTEFRIDRSVESLTLIVRKKSSRPAREDPGGRAAEGRALFESKDIRVVRPGPAGTPPATAASPNGLYWSSDYTYFDYIAAENPSPGIWTVEAPGVQLPEGEALEVLSRIATPLDLRVAARDSYYLNERAAITAMVFNARAGGPSEGQFEIQAHLAADGPLAASTVYVPMRPTGEPGRFALDVPDDLWSALKLAPAPGRIQAEFIAKSDDPWFIRRSPPITLQVVDPFIDWTTVASPSLKLPFRDVGAGFGGRLDPARTGAPAFDLPPTLTVIVERFDESAGAYGPWQREAMTPAADGAQFVYGHGARIGETGQYRYAYRLEGNTRRGPFVLESPPYPLEVRTNWLLLAIVAGALLVLAVFGSAATARLQGQVTLERPAREFRAEVVPPARLFDSARLEAAPTPLGGRRFVVRARRPFFRKRLELTMLAGEASLDGVPIRPGERRRLTAGDHRLAFQRSPGVQVEVKIALA